MAIPRFLSHALSAAVRRDGSADVLQQEALEEGRELAADLAGQIPGRTSTPTPAGATRPRTPHDMLLDTLSAKILGAWLQNRHQILYPLALNLRNLPDGHAGLIFTTITGALRTAGIPESDSKPRLERWLAAVGGTDAHRAELAATQAAPPALYETLERVEAAHLGPFAYAACLAALDQRLPTNRLFLEFLAARLNLPSDMSRSLAQRYRL